MLERKSGASQTQVEAHGTKAQFFHKYQITVPASQSKPLTIVSSKDSFLLLAAVVLDEFPGIQDKYTSESS